MPRHVQGLGLDWADLPPLTGATAMTATISAQLAEAAASRIFAEGMPTNGDDVITGTPEDDIVRLLAGDDTYTESFLESGNDKVFGGKGNDIIKLRGGDDVGKGGSGADEIDGGEGNDKLFGNGGADDLKDIGGGNDRIEGGGGDDRVSGGDDNDKVSGGSGDDNVSGGDGNDKVDGGAGDDRVSGGDGNDKVNGGDGNDSLNGGEGKDKFTGGNGDDTMFSTADGDRDQFYFDHRDGIDEIFSFEVGIDKIVVDSDRITRFRQIEFDESFGGAVVIIGRTEIELKSVSPDEIGKGDFIFV